MKTAVIGLGGIGGTLGAHLVNNGNEVVFIARGEHLEAIRQNGLKLHSPDLGDLTVHPYLATDDAAKAGIADVVLVCVKNYALEGAARTIAPMVDKHTLVIPLCNGVGIGDKLAGMLQKGRVLDGCIYISSFISAPGEITHVDNWIKIFFGPRDGVITSDMPAVKDMMLAAGINECTLSDQIERETWIKFSYICAFGACSSYYQANTGEIRTEAEKLIMQIKLFQEIIDVAKAKKIPIPENLLEKNMKILISVNPEIKSSLQRDFEIPGKLTEIDSFSGEVCRLGKKMGVPTPAHDKVLEKLASSSIVSI